MEISKKEFIERVRVISRNLKTPVFIVEEPISREINVYIDIISWNVSNPNVNNFNELRAKNITYWIRDAWYSLNQNNKFNTEYTIQQFETIKSETIQFSYNWVNWIRISL